MSAQPPSRAGRGAPARRPARRPGAAAPADSERPARGSGFDGALGRQGGARPPADPPPRSTGLRSDGTPRRSAPTAASRGRGRIPPPPRRPAAGGEDRPDRDRPDRRDDVWLDEGPAATSAPSRERIRRPKVPKPVIDTSELVALVGVRRAATLSTRLADAAVAFASERFPEARRILRPIVEEVPGSATARELLGLTQYRLGNWNDAAKHLEAHRQLSGFGVDQHPVLADCYRALRRFALVDELWAELCEVSPSAELVVEGRIVAAGALADRGRLADAVRLLEKGWRIPRSPRPHHLRRAYALADLYERSGEVPRARSLMGWVAGIDPDFADASERVAVLR